MAPLGALLWSQRNKVWYAAAIALLIIPNLSHLHPARFDPVDLEFWSAPQIARRNIGAATADEYRPRWLRPAPASAVANVTVVRQTRKTPEFWSGDVDLARASATEIPIAFFPGWRVRVDNRAVPAEPCANTGLLCVQAPAGKHRITAAWTGTGPSRAGDAISLVALALFALLVTHHRLRFKWKGWLHRIRWGEHPGAVGRIDASEPSATRSCA
jgi:hypothetical protein